MRVRVTIGVDARQRYVIAKYFGTARSRATRAEVRAFTKAAVVSAVREQLDAMTEAKRAVAQRLEGVETWDVVPLREPKEKQTSLVFQGEA